MAVEIDFVFLDLEGAVGFAVTAAAVVEDSSVTDLVLPTFGLPPRFLADVAYFPFGPLLRHHFDRHVVGSFAVAVAAVAVEAYSFAAVVSYHRASFQLAFGDFAGPSGSWGC